jgi:hypothetical protein
MAEDGEIRAMWMELLASDWLPDDSTMAVVADVRIQRPFARETPLLNRAAQLRIAADAAETWYVAVGRRGKR